MIAFGDFVLARPFWLLGLPAAALLTALALRHRHGLSGWAQVVAPQFLAFLKARGHVLAPRGTASPLLLAAVAVLAALALCGPTTRTKDAPGFRNLAVVFLVLDLSRSMTRGGGLDDLKAAAAGVLTDAGTRPVALALFAGESYLVSPPTSDPATLETAIAVLGEDTLPDRGSRPERALQAARQVLADADARQADLILLSDGGGLGPEADHAARVLAAEGTRVSAVYVAPEAAPYGLPVPDRAALERLARAGGGRLGEAGDSASLTRLVSGSGRLAPDSATAALLFHDHGRWLLWPALLPALLLFRRRSSQ